MEYDYKFLTVDEVPEYIQSREKLSGLIDTDNIDHVEEIGDGNLNLVFRAVDKQNNSLILKQALPYVRMVGEGWPMTPERSYFEINSLTTHYALAPNLVVKVLDDHPERYIFAMEDLSDYRVWRGLLNEGKTDNGVAKSLGEYAAKVLLGTSAFGMEREALAEAQRKAPNPQLCEITEDLVFTEPIHDIGRNSVLEQNEQDAKDFANDTKVRRLNSSAKWKFMTQGEALIHGDLHTGSVMVRGSGDGSEATGVKVFDSEFAFYGPIGFDLGAVLGNFVLAASRAVALGEDDRAEWLMSLCDETLDSFEETLSKNWSDTVDDPLWDESFLEEKLVQWRHEAWMFAATKMSRRIVGAAKTTDTETLEPALREGAARGVLLCARKIAEVLDVKADFTPTDSLESLNKELLAILQDAKTS